MNVCHSVEIISGCFAFEQVMFHLHRGCKYGARTLCLLYTILLLEVEAVLAEIENRVQFPRLHSQNANSNMV